VSAVLDALTAAILDPLLGAVVALGFLIWGAPGWGLWFDRHRDNDAQHHDPRCDDLFVQLVELAAFGSDYLALFFRLVFFAFPAVTAWVVLADASALLALAPFVFGLLGVGAHELRWRTPWGNTLSELLIGALWWALVLSMALAVPG
jgi:hypothetical protein